MRTTCSHVSKLWLPELLKRHLRLKLKEPDICNAKMVKWIKTCQHSLTTLKRTISSLFSSSLTAHEHVQGADDDRQIQ